MKGTTKMKTRAITLSMLLISILGIQNAATASDTGFQPSVPTPKILVRILALSGTGPDGNSYQLYTSQNGYVTSLDALGRIGSQVNGQGLKEGAYHTLYVRLHDRYQRIGVDGSNISGSFNEQGKPTYLRVRGMIMVKNGRATAMRMLDHASHDSYRHGGAERHDD